jgi:hypothetical protein
LKIIKKSNDEYKISQKISGINANITLIYDGNKLVKEISPFVSLELIENKQEIQKIINNIDGSINKSINNNNKLKEIDISNKVDNIRKEVKNIEKQQRIENKCSLFK